MGGVRHFLGLGVDSTTEGGGLPVYCFLVREGELIGVNFRFFLIWGFMFFEIFGPLGGGGSNLGFGLGFTNEQGREATGCSGPHG